MVTIGDHVKTSLKALFSLNPRKHAPSAAKKVIIPAHVFSDVNHVEKIHFLGFLRR
jgi:hypothetical protein